MSKVYLHETRCAGVNCLLKTVCFFNSIPPNLAKETIRNFITTNGDKKECFKFVAIPEEKKRN